MLWTSDGWKSLTMTACIAFFNVVDTTASPAYPFVNAAVAVLSLRFSFNAAYSRLGTLSDRPQMKSSEKSSAQLHGRPGGNAGGPTEDQVEDHPIGSHASWWTSGPWTKTIEMSQDSRAWSAILRDTVNELEAGQFRPGRSPPP